MKGIDEYVAGNISDYPQKKYVCDRVGSIGS